MKQKTLISSALSKSINKVLSKYNGRTSAGKVASFGTQSKRHDVILAAHRTLHDLGYHLTDAHSLKGKHIEALVKAWEDMDLSASTITDRLSILRVWAKWLGKAGMVETLARYSTRPLAPAKSLGAKKSHCWKDHGVCAKSRIDEVADEDPIVAMQLTLQAEFGLRAREAWLLKPFIADCGTFLQLTEGTKNGRPRAVAIETDQQREALEKAKSFVGSKLRSMIPSTHSLKQWSDHFYYVCRKHGISRAEGITPHGLRHEVANDHYQVMTGCISPVRGQKPGEVSVIEEIVARMRISQLLGHSREAITGAYLGPRLTRRPCAKDWDLSENDGE